MSGDAVHLEGDSAEPLVAAVGVLDRYNFVLIGGLAVMVRVGMAHRPTADVDGVFDNNTDVPTTELMVLAGDADQADAVQRVTVNGVNVDVIDTFDLPDEPSLLPDEPKDRLFVCAHRFAFDTARRTRILAGSAEADARVASVPGLIATKAHALRYATKERRATKRASDLYDLYRLLALHPDADLELAAAPWDLNMQVHAALRRDLAPLDQAVAVLQQNYDIDPADVRDVLAAVARS